VTPLLVFFSEVLGGLAPALAVLAILVKFIFYPLARWANRGVRENQDLAREMATTVRKIKNSYKGEEQAERILALYKERGYKAFLPMKSVGILFLQIPIFMLVFDSIISGDLPSEPAWIVKEITGPDALGNIFGVNLNILPFVMLAISSLSMIHINYLVPLEKHQIITGSLLSLSFFLILYQSPAALVFYWTLNIALQWAIDVILIRKGR
jgi:membrane protein insertase Oxa1/YidC/SpoIIIJ